MPNPRTRNRPATVTEAQLAVAADLRALAARVMAGEDVPAHKITHAMGQTTVSQCLHSLDAADLLMAPLRERGWKDMELRHLGSNLWAAMIFAPDALFFHRRITGAAAIMMAAVESQATGLARTITALALLCRAVELEHADADQR